MATGPKALPTVKDKIPVVIRQLSKREVVFEGFTGDMHSGNQDGVRRYTRGQNVKEVAGQPKSGKSTMNINGSGFDTDSPNRNQYFAPNFKEEEEDKDKKEETILTHEDMISLGLTSLKNMRTALNKTISEVKVPLEGLLRLAHNIATASIPSFISSFLSKN